MAYTVYPGINTLVPVRIVAGRAGKSVPVAGYPVAATIAVGGRDLYVASAGRPAVTAVNLGTMTPMAIKAGPGPAGPPFPVLSVIATAPGGRTVYVLGDGPDRRNAHPHQDALESRGQANQSWRQSRSYGHRALSTPSVDRHVH